MNKREQEKKRIPSPLPGEVVRESLLTEVERCREEVVVLQTGAGCGKTVLLAELARRQTGCCEWVWADKNGMMEAYHRILSFILSSKNGFCCLLVDEFERILEEDFRKEFGELIHSGRVRIILSVRGTLPMFLARYLIQGKVKIFDAEQLCFSQQETNLLLKRMTREDLPDQLTERVQAYTGGWPAGITFIGIWMRTHPCEKEQFPEFEQTQLHNYIYYEIFRGFSHDVQLFLTESAILEDLDAGLCDYVLERNNSRQMLATVLREIPFFLKRTNETEKFVYTPVFSGFLRNKMDPVRKKDILNRLIKYEEYDSRGQQENKCLKVKCLGCLDVISANGSILWRTKKTRELFACLFFEEGRGVRKDTLLERLWPDADEKQANALFYTTVTYLRKALTMADARELLVVENQIYRLDTVRIESDYQVLMEWNQQVRKGILPESWETQEFAELYRECYMCGEDYLWLGAQREYVEQIFLQTAAALAELEMGRGSFGKAVLLLERAIAIDNYAVSLLELLVECLLSMGNVGVAKNYFQRLQRIYQEDLYQKNVLNFRDYVMKVEKRNIRQDV